MLLDIAYCTACNQGKIYSFSTFAYRDLETEKAKLADLVLLLSDTVATLYSFLDIYPKAAIILSENDFIRRLVQSNDISNDYECTSWQFIRFLGNRLTDMYENIFPTLYHHFSETGLNEIRYT